MWCVDSVNRNEWKLNKTWIGNEWKLHKKWIGNEIGNLCLTLLQKNNPPKSWTTFIYHPFINHFSTLYKHSNYKILYLHKLILPRFDARPGLLNKVLTIMLWRWWCHGRFLNRRPRWHWLIPVILPRLLPLRVVPLAGPQDKEETNNWKYCWLRDTPAFQEDL